MKVKKKLGSAFGRIERLLVREFKADAEALKAHALELGKIRPPKLKAAIPDVIRKEFNTYYCRVLQELGQSIVLSESFARDLASKRA